MKLLKILGILLFIQIFAASNFGQTIDVAVVTNNNGEDNGPSNVTVTVSADNGILMPDITVTLTYTGSAVFGTDYTTNPVFTNGTTVTIPTSGALNASVAMELDFTPDTFFEGDEGITATISAPSAGAIGTASQSATIQDAEFIQLVSSASPIAENNGTTDYTAEISGSGTNVTGGVITVGIDWNLGTAVPITDLTGHVASTTIGIGSSTSANITVTAVSDKLLEAVETIGAQINGLTGAPVGAGYSSGTVSTSISDDEYIGLSATNSSIDEATLGSTNIAAVISGTGTVGASFVSGYGADINIEITWLAGLSTATLTDFTATPVGSPGLLTVVDGAATSSSVITLTAVNDVLIEGDEIFIPTISVSPVLVGGPGAPNSVTITIVDNDPELTAPGNTLTGVSLFPTFSWIDDGISTYVLEVATSSSFGGTIIATEALPAGTSSYQFTEEHASGAFPLNNSTTYYWRLYANGTVYSNTWSFTTVVGISIGVGNPANGSDVYQYDPLYFSWYIAQAQGNLKFRIEIIASGTDPSASSWYNGPWVVATDDIGAVYKTINGLLGGTKYWWRLIGYIDSNTDNAYNPADDKVVVFSQHYNFTTKGGAVTAYPSWPIGGNTIYTLTPMFGWYTLVYEPAATYQIIVATDATLTGGYLQTGVVGTYPGVAQSGTTFTIPGGELTYSTTYYWQVITHYNGYMAYSAVGSFVTYDDVAAVVNKPVLSYPTGGATIYTDSPTLYWWGNAYGSAINYSVEYSTTGGAPYTVWNTTSSDQFLSVSGLTPGDTYTWIVIADKGGANEVSSDPETFTVAGGSSSYPVLTYPVGGEMVYTSSPTLGWYVSGSTLGWSGYYVKWVKTTGVVADWAAEFGAVINDINQTNYTVSPALEEGESYKWAVALYDGVTPPVHADYVESSFSVYGGAGSITINLSTPADGATNIPTDVNFFWWVSGVTTSVTGYYVQYSPYADPNLDPNLGTQVSSTSTNLFASLSLSGGTTYKWRVVANLTSGGPVYSGWYEFTTLTTSLAVQPTAGSPSNGVTVGTDFAELSWYTKAAPPSDGQTYEVEVSESPKFESIKMSAESDKNSIQLAELEEGEYFWRVKGKNSEGDSYYSNIESFKVGDQVTDVEELSVVPDEFKVFQNYPNPFNPTTDIKFALSEASFVTIKIYNMLGQEVKTLISGEKTAGQYTVQWRGDNNSGQKVTSGTYIYRVTAQKNVVTKKMILLK